MNKRTSYWILISLVCFVIPACGGETATTNAQANASATTQASSSPANANQQASTPGATASASPAAPSGPMPASAYKVEWISNKVPAAMQAGKEQEVSVTFKNTGDGVWSAKDINVSYHWYQADKVAGKYDGLRTGLPRNVAAGEQVTVDKVRVAAPDKPGSYKLQLTLVQENVAWFETKGASTLTVPVTLR